jgi:hypothetical protein
MVAKGVGGEKDIPTRIDREIKMDRDTQTRILLLYKPKGFCV